MNIRSENKPERNEAKQAINERVEMLSRDI